MNRFIVEEETEANCIQKFSAIIKEIDEVRIKNLIKNKAERGFFENDEMINFNYLLSNQIYF